MYILSLEGHSNEHVEYPYLGLSFTIFFVRQDHSLQTQMTLVSFAAVFVMSRNPKNGCEGDYLQTFINQTVVTQHLHESHVSRCQIRSFWSSVCRICHVSLNVRIKVKKNRWFLALWAWAACVFGAYDYIYLECLWLRLSCMLMIIFILNGYDYSDLECVWLYWSCMVMIIFILSTYDYIYLVCLLKGAANCLILLLP